jgi:hypothetical protein
MLLIIFYQGITSLLLFYSFGMAYMMRCFEQHCKIVANFTSEIIGLPESAGSLRKPMLQAKQYANFGESKLLSLWC